MEQHWTLLFLFLAGQSVSCSGLPSSGLGLTSFSQYDLCLSCFERALILATDTLAGDVWYNISQVAVVIGDKNLAYQVFDRLFIRNPKC